MVDSSPFWIPEPFNTSLSHFLIQSVIQSFNKHAGTPWEPGMMMGAGNPVHSGRQTNGGPKCYGV